MTGFEPDQIPDGWRPEAELDRWILSELNQLAQQVDDHLDNYNPTDAGRRIQEFVDVLSNWYVRRSRRRFWKSENDADKRGGYATLYACLTTVARLMAPLAPFVAEQMYRNLELRYNPDGPDSVHLADYPVADASLIDRPLMDATRLAMRVSSMGRSARSKAGLKVRQPLAEVVVRTRAPEEAEYLGWVQGQILEELNVKSLRADAGHGIYAPAQEAAGADTDAVVSVDGYSAALEAGYMVAVDARLTPELADEGLARELAHRIQNLRKNARFEITDRIVTYYQGPDDMARVMAVHRDYIMQEDVERCPAGRPPSDGRCRRQVGNAASGGHGSRPGRAPGRIRIGRYARTAGGGEHPPVPAAFRAGGPAAGRAGNHLGQHRPPPAGGRVH